MIKGVVIMKKVFCAVLALLLLLTLPVFASAGEKALDAADADRLMAGDSFIYRYDVIFIELTEKAAADPSAALADLRAEADVSSVRTTGAFVFGKMYPAVVRDGTSYGRYYSVFLGSRDKETWSKMYALIGAKDYVSRTSYYVLGLGQYGEYDPAFIEVDTIFGTHDDYSCVEKYLAGVDGIALFSMNSCRDSDYNGPASFEIRVKEPFDKNYLPVIRSLCASGYCTFIGKCYNSSGENRDPVIVINKQYYGDADLDGKVTAGDARAILRFAVGLDSPEHMPGILSDVDSDGTISAADARSALRMAVGLDELMIIW